MAAGTATLRDPFGGTTLTGDGNHGPEPITTTLTGVSAMQARAWVPETGSAPASPDLPEPDPKWFALNNPHDIDFVLKAGCFSRHGLQDFV